MDTLFRRYFWTVNLAFILLASFLVARTVNAFVAAALTPVPSGAAAARRAAAPARVAPLATLDMERFARLVGLPLPPPPVPVSEPVVAEVDLNAPPVKSGLRVKLLGTLVSSDPLWSFASVQDVSTNRAQSYMVGDRIMGAEVLDIERERVIVLNNNRREFIDNQPGSGEGMAPPLPSGPAVQPPIVTASVAPGTAVTGSGIKQLTDNEYEVPKTEIDKTMANLNDVAMQARIVPAFKDGVAQGFKLFSIRPDSIYSKIGVQNGDVIRRINGLDLNSPEKALEVYSKLKEAPRIDIELERNGATVRKTYNVR
jgi:general secretion pathway protein C